MAVHRALRRMTGGWLLVTSALLLVALAACGNPAPPKVYRVGILAGLDFFAGSTVGFKTKMKELGYVEGRNIVYEYHKTNVDPAAEEAILRKFVNDKVDLMFVFPTEVSLTAKAIAKGTNMPVVFANAVIEGTELVNSVRDPGGNITGVRFPGPSLAIKRLELLHEMAPDAKRVWVTYLKGYPMVPHELDVLRPAAASMGITLVEVPATSIADIKADLDARERSGDIGIDAMVIIPEPLTTSPDTFAVLGRFAAEHKIPVGGAAVSAGEYHSLFGLTPDATVTGEQAALLADKILKGTPAGSLPVVSPENVLEINYKVAQGLGLTVSDGLLQMANRVVR